MGQACALGVLLLLASRARAEAALALSVTRGPGAETCPDPEVLRARVQALRGVADSPGRGHYQLDFARLDSGFEATLRARASEADSESVRVLRAPGDSCAGLAEASAVTLALLLDAAPATPEPVAVVEPPPVEPPRPPPPPIDIPAPPRLHPRALLALGEQNSFGVLRAYLPALLVEAGIELARFRATLGVLWAIPHTSRFDPGRLRETLLAGSARVCAPLTPQRALRLDACSGLFAGAFTVRARGYSHDGAHSHRFVAAPLELALSAGSAQLWAELSAGALFAARPPDVTVTGLGTFHRSWPVSPLVSLRVFGALP